MKEKRQIAWGVALAALTSLVILGGVILSLAENRFSLGAQNTPTRIQLEQEMPTLVFISPVIPTLTSQPAPSATFTPTLTPLPACPIPAGWMAVVLPSDELSQALALRYGISVEELASANCWDYPPSTVLAGTSLFIPEMEVEATSTPSEGCGLAGGQICPTLSSSPSPTPTLTKTCQKRTDWPVYIVRSGDTLFSLSNRIGVSINLLQQANCMGNSTVLRRGQALYVPRLPAPPVLPTWTPYPKRPPYRSPTPTWWVFPPPATPGYPPPVRPTVGSTLPLHPPSATPGSPLPPLPPPPLVFPDLGKNLPAALPGATPGPPPLASFPAAYIQTPKGIGSQCYQPV